MDDEIDGKRLGEKKNFFCQTLLKIRCGIIGTCKKKYKTRKNLERHRRILHDDYTEELITKRVLSNLISRSFDIKR